jgi:hypothetical protein
MMNVERGVARFERWRQESGASPAMAALQAARFRAGAERMARFMACMKVHLDNLGVTVTQRRHYRNFAEQVCAICRRVSGPEAVALVVGTAVRWIRQGLVPEKVAVVALRSLQACGNNRMLEPAEMVAAIEARSRELTDLPTGGNMSEEQKTVQADTPAGTPADSSAEPERKARRAMARRARVPGVPQAMFKETVLEQYKRNRAAAELRKALAMHQPIVRMVVIERIARHRSFAQLARQFKLAEENVAEILAKIRPWVKQYTTYYDEDWHWVENARVEVRLPAGAPAGPGLQPA